MKQNEQVTKMPARKAQAAKPLLRAADARKAAGNVRDDSAEERALPSYTPVQTRRAFEEVADQIRQQLWQGTLRPGDRLPAERDLAEQFNLSRNTVREALRSLEMAGVLEFRKGATGGAFVREGRGDAVVSGFADLFRLGAIQPQHLTEARILVAVQITRLVCQRGTKADFDALQTNVQAMEDAGENVELRVATSMEFHRIMAKATGNPVLIILTDALLELLKQLLETLKPAPEGPVISARRRLLRHILARDEDKAAAEMETHLKSLQRFYLAQEFPTR